jgi:hypothetical protein
MIKKFRKKPVTIEAVLLENTDSSIQEAMAFMNLVIDSGIKKTESKDNDERVLDYFDMCKNKGGIEISTLEGVMKANFGDWIIKGVNGEFYPCKPDIFEKTYEELN